MRDSGELNKPSFCVAGFAGVRRVERSVVREVALLTEPRKVGAVSGLAVVLRVVVQVCNREDNPNERSVFVKSLHSLV